MFGDNNEKSPIVHIFSTPLRHGPSPDQVRISLMNHFSNEIDQVGTIFQKQVPCQLQQILCKFSAWYAPFFIVTGRYY
jgi:hypothetical protein